MNNKNSKKADWQIIKEYQDEILKLRKQKEQANEALIFLRSLVSQGHDMKEVFLEKVPEVLMLKYEIKLFKSLIIRIENSNFLSRYFVRKILREKIRDHELRIR